MEAWDISSVSFSNAQRGVELSDARMCGGAGMFDALSDLAPGDTGFHAVRHAARIGPDSVIRGRAGVRVGILLTTKREAFPIVSLGTRT